MTNDKVNILVVDDLPDKVLVLESILEELGENIVIAYSGSEALRHVLEHDFAVILLDVNMPDIDGIDTAALIRRRKKSAHTPIIFVTAYADEMQTAKGYSLGAVDYILSPVVPEILRSKVKVFVDLFRMNQQIKQQAEERIALAEEQAGRAAAEESTCRSNFLAEASKILVSSLDLKATLRGLARVSVPFLADLSAVTRIDPQGRIGLTELAWQDSSGKWGTCTLEDQQTMHQELAQAMQRVFAGGKVEWLENLDSWGPPPVNESYHDNGEQNSSWPVFSLQTLVVLPLLARGRSSCVLTLAQGHSGRQFSLADLALAEDLASRAAMALDNACLYQSIQEADRHKNEFLAMLAHELRNPLAPIRNAVEVLRMVGPNEPSMVKARDMINRQVTHMARVIDDLLDMSRISRGKMLLRKESTDLVEVIKGVIEDYQTRLESAGQKLQVCLPDEPVWTLGDPTRLAQVVGNVLHNAHKFTDAGGIVAIELGREPAGQMARITICDTGIGMEPAILERVFDTFTQADRTLDRSRGGLGLGLALVKGLVLLHGGEVSAESQGLGKGTEISIHLPVTEQPLPKWESAVPSSRDKSPSRILVIEDNLDAAESMRMLLTLAGHQVQVAGTGSAGVEAARQFHPEVVLCDIGLPGGMDGYAVARALRQDLELNSPYLIALTGYGQAGDKDRSRQAGFDVHLIKPVDYGELERLLESVPARVGASG
jgi:signal transduction histidine kinase/DNA-binding response OmpR family regulator